MTPTMKSLGIDRLTIDQRLALVEEIWGSIREEGPPPLSDAMRQELERRWQDDQAHPEDVIRWEQVEREILQKLDQ